MSDTTQAVYDAVRSRIGNVNVSQVVEDAARQAFDISHMRPIIQQEICIAAGEYGRPCVVFKARLHNYSDHWTAVFGDGINEVSASGKSPYEAMAAFDAEWVRRKP